MPESEIPQLEGSILAVRYGSRGRDYEYVRVERLEMQGGRPFLVGKTVSTPYDETEGLRFCVAWDAVRAYYEFESLDELHAYINAWYPPKK